MTDIFISYKREDEVRVSRLAAVWQDAGYAVWWDRHLVGGESWRTQIQAALDAAKCVMVIWTHDSTGASGDFVHDEASQAKRRGILIPVRFDNIDPPLGFGEIQTLDLIDWNGDAHDPFFEDLCAAISAKMEGRFAPPTKAPSERLKQLWRRRLAWSSVVTIICVGGAIGFNLCSALTKNCAAYRFSSRNCPTGAGKPVSATGRHSRNATPGKTANPTTATHCARISNGSRRVRIVILLSTC